MFKKIEVILYPTETVYGLGVSVFNEAAWQGLCELKGRDESQTASWLVRDVADVERYGVMSEVAAAIAERWLPGPLTLVLPARDNIEVPTITPERTIGFRISSDPCAQQLIAEYMAEHDAPLTCTSANVSGQPPLSTPAEILGQFTYADRDISTISRTIDDGPRSGEVSTVVRVMGDTVEVLRAGSISAAKIEAVAS